LTDPIGHKSRDDQNNGNDQGIPFFAEGINGKNQNASKEYSDDYRGGWDPIKKGAIANMDTRQSNNPRKPCLGKSTFFNGTSSFPAKKF